VAEGQTKARSAAGPSRPASCETARPEWSEGQPQIKKGLAFKKVGKITFGRFVFLGVKILIEFVLESNYFVECILFPAGWLVFLGKGILFLESC